MRKLIGSLATLSAVAGALLATTGPASAASGCSGSGGVHTEEPYGFRYGSTNCNVYSTGNVMADGAVSGVLHAGTNWFVCQEQFTDRPNPAVGAARNNWWLYTQADTGSAPLHGWGWFPATRVSGGGNFEPIPGLTNCANFPIIPVASP